MERLQYSSQSWLPILNPKHDLLLSDLLMLSDLLLSNLLQSMRRILSLTKSPRRLMRKTLPLHLPTYQETQRHM